MSRARPFSQLKNAEFDNELAQGTKMYLKLLDDLHRELGFRRTKSGLAIRNKLRPAIERIRTALKS
jgi:hypothetical protein